MFTLENCNNKVDSTKHGRDTQVSLVRNIHMSAAGPGALIIEYGGVAYHVKSAKPNQISAPDGGNHPKCDCIEFWICHILVSDHNWDIVVTYRRCKWKDKQED